MGKDNSVISLDELRRGTWLAHASKHLTAVDSSVPELNYFEASYQAGKAGNLLARLASDTTEVLDEAKVKALARAAHVRSTELDHCLRLLKAQGRIDYTEHGGSITEVEVYSFSSRDALITTSRIFDTLGASDEERASLPTLEATFYLPRTQSEMIELIVVQGIKEETAVLSLDLQQALGLVKVSEHRDTRLFFNEYAFNDDPQKAIRAVSSLDSQTLRNVKDIQDVLRGKPGYPLEVLGKNFPPKVLELMQGIGLIDAMQVRSPNGSRTFATIPQLRGIAIDQPVLSLDVFHKAKKLLNCLRYGQFYSDPGRGKILSDEMLINIVRKLVRGEELKPSTAAGEDYKVLERDGVIQTRPAGGGMFIMSLRQKEVGQIVLQMLEHNAALPEMDIPLLTSLGARPVSVEIPEVHRASLLTRRTEEVRAAESALLQVLRTGAKAI